MSLVLTAEETLRDSRSVVVTQRRKSLSRDGRRLFSRAREVIQRRSFRSNTDDDANVPYHRRRKPRGHAHRLQSLRRVQIVHDEHHHARRRRRQFLQQPREAPPRLLHRLWHAMKPLTSEHLAHAFAPHPQHVLKIALARRRSSTTREHRRRFLFTHCLPRRLLVRRHHRRPLAHDLHKLREHRTRPTTARALQHQDVRRAVARRVRLQRPQRLPPPHERPSRVRPRRRPRRSLHRESTPLRSLRARDRRSHRRQTQVSAVDRILDAHHRRRARRRRVDGRARRTVARAPRGRLEDGFRPLVPRIVARARARRHDASRDDGTDSRDFLE